MCSAPPWSQSQGRHPSMSLLRPQCSGCRRRHHRFNPIHHKSTALFCNTQYKPPQAVILKSQNHPHPLSSVLLTGSGAWKQTPFPPSFKRKLPEDSSFLVSPLFFIHLLWMWAPDPQRAGRTTAQHTVPEQRAARGLLGLCSGLCLCRAVPLQLAQQPASLV